VLGNRVDHVVVEVAECPTFAGFERLHDTVSDVVEVPRGVLVRGVVAAADAAALHAQSQVDPLPTDLEAVFAAFDGARFDRFDVGQVYTRHRKSLSHVRRTVNSHRRPYRHLCASWSGVEVVRYGCGREVRVACTASAGLVQLAPLRSWLVAGCLTLALVACGGGSLSLTEYAERLSGLAVELGETLDAGDVQMTTGTPTLADAESVLTSAVAARTSFQNGLTALDPPDEFADVHADFIEVHSRIIAAQEAFVAQARTAATLEELDQSAEAEAYRAIGTEAASLCEEFRANIDATADREVFADTPWIPSNMKEVVEVTFRC
jgi:hypothetical protein